MPITYKNGNAVSALIDGEIDVLLHVCNNKGVMGSGIALEIKNRIPNAYRAYITSDISMGDISLGYLPRGSQVVVANMVAQDGYGEGIRHLNYGALADCLDRVSSISYKDDYKIGLPYKMGADRAGGDWEIVLELVEYFLQDFNVVVYKLEG